MFIKKYLKWISTFLVLTGILLILLALSSSANMEWDYLECETETVTIIFEPCETPGVCNIIFAFNITRFGLLAHSSPII